MAPWGWIITGVVTYAGVGLVVGRVIYLLGYESKGDNNPYENHAAVAFGAAWPIALPTLLVVALGMGAKAIITAPPRRVRHARKRDRLQALQAARKAEVVELAHRYALPVPDSRTPDQIIDDLLAELSRVSDDEARG